MKVFSSINYTFVSIHPKDYKRSYLSKFQNPSILIASEDDFIKFHELLQPKKSIYLATTTYFEYNNARIMEATTSFNFKHKSNIVPSRLILNTDKVQNSLRRADHILLIGSKHTLTTYPLELHKKIFVIPNIAMADSRYSQDQKSRHINKRKFIWMSSEGTLLRGLDKLIESFNCFSNLELHIIGPLDKGFKESPLFIEKNNNIIYHGKMFIGDTKFLNLVYEIAWIFYPTLSDVIPGSLINLMSMGCIPISTTISGISALDNIGLVLNHVTTEEIKSLLNKSQSYSDDEILKLSSKSRDYAVSEYSRSSFERQLNKFLVQHNFI